MPPFLQKVGYSLIEFQCSMYKPIRQRLTTFHACVYCIKINRTKQAIFNNHSNWNTKRKRISDWQFGGQPSHDFRIASHSAWESWPWFDHRGVQNAVTFEHSCARIKWSVEVFGHTLALSVDWNLSDQRSLRSGIIWSELHWKAHWSHQTRIWANKKIKSDYQAQDSLILGGLHARFILISSFERTIVWSETATSKQKLYFSLFSNVPI